MEKKLPALKIGDFTVDPPIIQGGMGVRVSRSNLAAAVANEGGVGVIAGVGLGKFEDLPGKEFVSVNDTALREEIRKARGMMTRGVLGVNLMVALSNYEELVRTAVEEGIDVIISGAGLPLDLPKYTEGKNVALVPIVSSARALKIIAGKWKRNFNRLPDAVVVEGAKAGGHIGFDPDEVIEGRTTPLEDLIKDVVEYANTFDPEIPVIAAGGVFDGKDIAKFIKLGASGVQMGTRFVCTDECDVHQNFKQAYIDAKEEDLIIIKSPVGMPGRVLKNKFVEAVLKGKTTPAACNFRCLRSCDPKKAPYCIAKALANAAEGNLDEGFVFAGSNAYRCNEIVSVKHLMDELVAEAEENL
ncbi:nitronate monooxygenase [bacterium BMS3Bbin09]|nr:nitronate monooxygenase [bacterium BMS3Bbin09]HDN95189.1 nitronate monooxygenase [Nitrospirota bacterium]